MHWQPATCGSTAAAHDSEQSFLKICPFAECELPVASGWASSEMLCLENSAVQWVLACNASIQSTSYHTDTTCATPQFLTWAIDSQSCRPQIIPWTCVAKAYAPGRGYMHLPFPAQGEQQQAGHLTVRMQHCPCCCLANSNVPPAAAAPDRTPSPSHHTYQHVLVQLQQPHLMEHGAACWGGEQQLRVQLLQQVPEASVKSADPASALAPAPAPTSAQARRLQGGSAGLPLQGTFETACCA